MSLVGLQVAIVPNPNSLCSGDWRVRHKFITLATQFEMDKAI